MRRVWTWVRVLGGLLILGLLVQRLGTAPFREGLAALDARALLLGALLAVLTTLASAWRWRVVARSLGVGLPLPVAVASCYRSQFLNSVLPGGVLGDVHRGVSHGRQAGRVGAGVRAVAWERVLGLVVLSAIALPVSGALVDGPLPWLLTGSALVIAAVVVATVPGVPSLSPRGWAAVVAASLLATTGYVLTFAVAAESVGAELTPATLLPIALLVLLASSIPVNVGGWGPREGAAAWVFGLAGLGASLGVSVSVAYGVMGLVSTLPGGVILLLGHLERDPAPVPGEGGAR
ncbi:conserved membrane hypothetical protein [metagenome]|uniref:Uncharacterized protein n=1 Tax=metagenome TaxID=256318 RepID=A0A2P2BZV1_9ZZZZ